MNQSNGKPIFFALFIFLLNLLIFFILFVFRSLDDNRLTSWKWVFADIHIAPILAILIPGLILAYALSKTSHLERNPIYLLLISFFLAAIFWKVPEVIIDASRYFTQAKHLNEYGIAYFLDEWGRDIMAWTDLPAVPLLYGLVYKFFGEYRFVIQVFTTLLFSMTVGLTYLIGNLSGTKTPVFRLDGLCWVFPTSIRRYRLCLLMYQPCFFSPLRSSP